MFTNNRIALRSFQGKTVSAIEVHRDVSFCYIGKVPTRLANRVVPAVSAGQIAQISMESGIVGVITVPDLMQLVPESLGLATAEDPLLAAYEIHESLCRMEDFHWKSFATRIDRSARVHPSAVVAERDVVIGPNVEVGPTSVVLERSILEDGARIGVGVVVGLDGFEIFEGVTPRRILNQAGGVWLEPGATVLANSTIVRSTFGGFTRLGEGSMVDVLIHVAHDVVLGKNSTIVACAEISGRCDIGERAYIGPNACIRNGIAIGKSATVSMGSVVTTDVPEGATVSGNFAVKHDLWLDFIKSLAANERVDEIDGV